MRTDPSTPVLLRRIAQLEATVGRLSEDIGSLRSAVGKQGLRPTAPPRGRSRALQAAGPTADAPRAVAGGLAGATAPGEAARVQWVKDGVVVPGEQLAKAWASPAKPWRRQPSVVTCVR